MVKCCVNCSKILTGKQLKYCCFRCKNTTINRLARQKLKQKYIDYKGGKCCKCGYSKCNDALQFHHLKDKKFGISYNGIRRPWKVVKQELDKCILVCANCHAEIHSKK